MDGKGKDGDGSAARQARLAAALRDNLHRRKRQQRARRMPAAAEETLPETPPGCGENDDGG